MQFTFAHNNFNVRDLDRSLAFYQEALGLSEVRRISPDAVSYTHLDVYKRQPFGSTRNIHPQILHRDHAVFIRQNR